MHSCLVSWINNVCYIFLNDRWDVVFKIWYCFKDECGRIYPKIPTEEIKYTEVQQHQEVDKMAGLFFKMGHEWGKRRRGEKNQDKKKIRLEEKKKGRDLGKIIITDSLGFIGFSIITLWLPFEIYWEYSWKLWQTALLF